MGHALADHFRAFYRQGPPNQWKWTPTTVSTVNLAQQQYLIPPFSNKEVKAAVWGLNSEGTLGSDGIPLFFYKECWDVIGPEVMAVMEEFHAGRCQMESLNKVYLVFLPKTAGAEYTGNFRPISLSNSIYLIIAKAVANRLFEVLNGPISPFQFTFILGWQMIDNIMLAEEMVAAWRRSGDSCGKWKVDFAKAYDSIDWRFL